MGSGCDVSAQAKINPNNTGRLSDLTETSALLIRTCPSPLKRDMSATTGQTKPEGSIWLMLS